MLIIIIGEVVMEVNIDIDEKVIHGIKVINIKSPSALTSYVGYFSLSGSFAENDKERGIAHVLEHMFFKGTEKRSYVDINEDAAIIGADQNAYTSKYETCYHLTCPSMSYKDALELLSDQMFNPTFPTEELDKEREVIQEERQMGEDDHGDFYFRSLVNDVFNKQLRHPVIGYEDSIDSFTREDLIAYKKKFYGANNTVLLIAGPHDCSEIFETCEEMLKGHTLGTSEIPVIEEGILDNYEDYTITRSNIHQSYVSMYFDSDNLSGFNPAHKCMMNALAGGMYSILNTEIREKLGLCYSIYSFEYARNKTDGVGLVHTMVSPSNVALAQEKILENIGLIRENGISEKIFKCAKAKMVADWCKIMENPKHLSRSVAQKTLMGIETHLNNDYQAVLDLTHEDVNNYAKDFFTDQKFGWYIMNPK
jgi:predicted Zn-dependent peptidase